MKADRPGRRPERGIRQRAKADGTVFYQHRYTDSAGKVRARSFPSLAEAKAHRGQIDALRASLGSRIDTSSSERLRVWATRWLERGSGELARSTHRGYESAMAARVLPHLGSVQLRDLHAQRIRAWMGQLHDAGFSNYAINQALAVLSACLTSAVDDGRLETNPCLNVRRRRHVGAARCVPTPEEVVRLWAYMPSERDRMRVMTSFLLGLRPSEASGLRGSAFATDLQTVRLTEVFSSAKEARGIKNGLTNPVPVTPLLQKLLGPYIESLDDPQGLLFANRDGDHYRVTNWAVRVWRPARVAAGLLDQMSPYSLRHAFASLLLNEGLSPADVQWRTRHSDQATLLGYYSHSYHGRLPARISLEDATRDAMERVSRQLAGMELPIHRHGRPRQGSARGGAPRRWTNGQLLDAYLRVADALEEAELGRNTYLRYRDDHDPALPSAGALVRRFGTWAAVVKRADSWRSRR